MSIDDETGPRRSFTCPPQTGKFRGIDLDFLDPDDPDDRRFLILAEHPELHNAIDNEIPEIELHGQTINPELHIAVHEVQANQLWATTRRRRGRPRSACSRSDTTVTKSCTC